jgi:tetratricopeptide (TPR) repeat protein
LGDLAAEGRALRSIAYALVGLGRPHDAMPHYEEAIVKLTTAGAGVDVARTHLFLASALDAIGEAGKALDHARKAFEVCAGIGDRTGEAHSLNGVGWYLAKAGRPREGLPFCEQALSMLVELDNIAGQATTCDSLGFIHHRIGNLESATAYYRKAKNHFREIGDQVHVGHALAGLGDVYMTGGQASVAVQHWRQAYAVLDRLGHPDADLVLAKLRSAA